MRETSDAIGKIRDIRIVGLVIKMDLFGCVFNDKWLTKFDQSYIHLKVEVIFCVIVEPSEDVNAVSVWDL